MAIDTEVQRSNVLPGGKCCGINGKDIVLTWEALILREDRESAAAIVVLKLL